MKRRVLNLLAPMIIWCIIETLLLTLIDRQFSIHLIIELFLSKVVSSYWFIWAVIVYSLVLATLFKYKLDNVYILLFVNIVLLGIPVDHFLFNVLETMFPFFIVGYLFSKINTGRVVDWCQRYYFLFIIGSIVCFVLWQPQYFAYQTKSSWEHIGITLFRFVTGIIVSISFMIICYLLYKRTGNNRVIMFCSRLGQESLGIYLIQGLFFTLGMNIAYIHLVDYCNTLIFVLPSILLTVLFYYVVVLTSANKKIGWLLYGKSV